MSKESNASGGIGFSGMLVILFIGLKLTGHIDWSWWWVFAPVWIPLLFFVALVIVVTLVSLAFGKRPYVRYRRPR